MIYGTPIAARLNNHAPGANLTVNDIPPLMSLCAFESIANDGPSPFCSLFSSQEFSQYEYFTDLGKYYGTGCVSTTSIVSTDIPTIHPVPAHI